MSFQLSCLLDGEGFPRKKKRKRRKGPGYDALALNQFFFFFFFFWLSYLRGPLLPTKTRRAYPTSLSRPTCYTVLAT
jgi:hypothetical protein